MRKWKGNPSQHTALNRRLEHFIEYWLVPLILVAIASVQILLTFTADLSPWKGGGFGMFASIDAPGMRVMSAEALDAQGNQLLLDAEGIIDGETYSRIRTLPRRHDLETLAPQLIGKNIVPMDWRQQVAYGSMHKSSGRSVDTETDVKTDLESDGVDRDREVITQNTFSRSTAPQPLSTLSPFHIGPVYRLQTPRDPTSDDIEFPSIQAIRLQWWRLQFDAKELTVHAIPLTDVVESGNGS